MTAKQMRSLLAGGLVILVILCIVSAFAADIPLVNKIVATKDTTPPPEVSLAIIAGAAVAIERALEMFWTGVNYTKGKYWPLGEVQKEIDRRVGAFGESMQPYLDGLKKVAAELPDKEEIEGKIEEVRTWVATASSQLGAVDTNNEKLDQLALQASRRVNAIVAAYPKLRKEIGSEVDLAADLADSAKDFLQGFKDNPGRRIISIYVGALIGVVIATIAGLDVFGSALADDEVVLHPFGRAAVPITGVVMGLGANPTHEIIAALQKYKESKKPSP